MPKYRITGKTSDFLTPYGPRAAAPAKHKRWKSDTLLPRAVEVAKKPRKVTKVCKITVERPGEPTQVYHTRSSNEVLP